MKKNTKFDFLLRIFMVFAILFSNFGNYGIVLANTNKTWDIKDPVNDNGSLSKPGDVKLTKTVSKTDVDGEYLVTLDVKGKNVTTSESKEAVPYIVFVLDISTTMAWKMSKNECEYDWQCEYDYKINIAKEKAIEFSKSLLKKYPKAKIALVEFGDNAKLQRNFKSQAFTKSDFSAEESHFSEGEFSGLESATNIAAGLRLAANKLNGKDSKHIILLTDGMPESYDLPGDLEWTTENYVNDTMNAANYAKGIVDDIFTIGFGFDPEYKYKDEKKLLQNIATKPSYFYLANTGNKLNDDFKAITSNITTTSPAGTNAKIKDVIKEGFEYIPGSASPSNATINDNEITFDIGNITETGSSVSFKIKALESHLSNGWNETNEYAEVSYDKPNNSKDSVKISESSSVYYNLSNYQVNYYKDSMSDDNLLYRLNGKGEVGTLINVDENLKKPDGYNTINENKDFVINIDNEKNIINIIYTKKSNLKYTINYFKDSQDNSNKLGSATEENKTFLDEVTLNDDILNAYKPSFGYKNGVVSSSNMHESGSYVVKDQDNYINVCYYKRTDFKYTVRYLDLVGRTPLYDDEKFDNITYMENVHLTAKPALKGYLMPEESTKDVVIDEENKVIEFLYPRKKYSVTVRYVDDETNNEIANSKTIKNKEYKSIHTEEAIEIKGYILMGDNTKSIEINTENNEIVFRYTIRTDLEYTVKYLDRETGKSLENEKVVKNQRYRNIVKEDAIDIKGYVLDDEKTKELKIDVENNEIVFYYKIKDNLSYAVKYLDKKTGNSISDNKVVRNLKYKDVIKEEYIKIDGYKLVSEPIKMITISDEGENVIAFLYEKRNDLRYVVKYIDAETNKEIAPRKIVENQTYMCEVKEYPIDIDGYTTKDKGKTLTVHYNEALNEIVFKYNKRTDLSYSVLYYLDGEIDSSKTDVFTNQSFLDVVETYTDKMPTYYALDKVENLPLTISNNNDENVIKVYYVSAGEGDIEPPKTGIDTNPWLSVLGLSSILLGLVKIKRIKEN